MYYDLNFLKIWANLREALIFLKFSLAGRHVCVCTTAPRGPNYHPPTHQTLKLIHPEYIRRSRRLSLLPSFRIVSHRRPQQGTKELNSTSLEIQRLPATVALFGEWKNVHTCS